MPVRLQCCDAVQVQVLQVPGSWWSRDVKSHCHGAVQHNRPLYVARVIPQPMGKQLGNRSYGVTPSAAAARRKTAGAGNPWELRHAAEYTSPDCEALLHSPSTLLRIAARGKR